MIWRSSPWTDDIEALFNTVYLRVCRKFLRFRITKFTKWVSFISLIKCIIISWSITRLLQYYFVWIQASNSLPYACESGSAPLHHQLVPHNFRSATKDLLWHSQKSVALFCGTLKNVALLNTAFWFLRRNLAIMNVLFILLRQLLSIDEAGIRYTFVIV